MLSAGRCLRQALTPQLDCGRLENLERRRQWASWIGGCFGESRTPFSHLFLDGCKRCMLWSDPVSQEVEAVVGWSGPFMVQDMHLPQP